MCCIYLFAGSIGDCTSSRLETFHNIEHADIVGSDHAPCGAPQGRELALGIHGLLPLQAGAGGYTLLHKTETKICVYIYIYICAG